MHFDISSNKIWVRFLRQISVFINASLSISKNLLLLFITDSFDLVFISIMKDVSSIDSINIYLRILRQIYMFIKKSSPL